MRHIGIVPAEKRLMVDLYLVSTFRSSKQLISRRISARSCDNMFPETSKPYYKSCCCCVSNEVAFQALVDACCFVIAPNVFRLDDFRNCGFGFFVSGVQTPSNRSILRVHRLRQNANQVLQEERKALALVSESNKALALVSESNLSGRFANRFTPAF